MAALLLFVLACGLYVLSGNWIVRYWRNFLTIEIVVKGFIALVMVFFLFLTTIEKNIELAIPLWIFFVGGMVSGRWRLLL